MFSQQVEENFYMSRMEPAIREYLTKMREEAYIDIKPGYTDQRRQPEGDQAGLQRLYSALAKKKKKVERTRFRETTHIFRQKGSLEDQRRRHKLAAPLRHRKLPATKKKNGKVDPASMKPGKKEKIRFGKAPTTTLPPALAIHRPKMPGSSVQTRRPLQSR